MAQAENAAPTRSASSSDRGSVAHRGTPLALAFATDLAVAQLADDDVSDATLFEELELESVGTQRLLRAIGA